MTHAIAPQTPIAATARLATLGIIAASALFGLVPLFARELQALGVGDTAIAFYRYGLTAIAVAAFYPRGRAKRRQAIVLTTAGMLMGLGWTGYLALLGSCTVAAAGVVYMSYPVFTVLFAWALAGLRPSLRSAGACLLVLLAATVLVGGNTGGLSLGVVISALPAPIFFGLMIVATSALVPDLSTPERLACGAIGSVIGLAPVLFADGVASLLPADMSAVLPLALALVLVTALIPQWIYVTCASQVGPARAAAAGSVELPTMILIGWLVFAESVGARELIAAALILTAVTMPPAIDTSKLRRRI